MVPIFASNVYIYIYLSLTFMILWLKFIAVCIKAVKMKLFVTEQNRLRIASFHVRHTLYGALSAFC